jgi:alpha-beta hydrolase superfamily lysophospholipase
MNLCKKSQLGQTLLTATKQVKSIKFSRGLLVSALVALSQTAALSALASPAMAADACLIGSPCAADPACKIVGNTHMLEWKSKTPAKIIVVCIHGLGLCAMAYKQLAKEFSDAGLDGYGVNVRGFGPDRDKADYAKLNCIDTVGDIGRLLLDIRKQYPGYKVYLVGESMGGALAIRAAAENAELIDGVVCSAPAWKLLKMQSTAVKGVVELYLFRSRKPGIASRGVIHQATTDHELREHWLTGQSHKMKLSRKEAFDFVRFVSKTDSYARKLEVPVLVMQGLDDHLVSPKAVAELFGDIPARSKEFLIDAKGEHLLLEEGNFSPALLEKMLAWLKADHPSNLSSTLITVLNEQSLSAPKAHRLLRLKKLANNNW